MHELVRPAPASVPGLAELVPAFTILLDDISETTDAQLRARALAAFPKLVLWLLRDARRGDVLLRRLRTCADAFHAVAGAPGGIVAMHRVLRYLELVLSEQRFDRVRGILAGLTSTTEEAVVTYSDRVFAQGRAEGQRDALLRMLAVKFGPPSDAIVARIRTADASALERWLERIVAATQLDAVFDA